MKLHKLLQNHGNGGYVLPLAVIATLVIGAGMTSAATRAYVDYKGAHRQSEARRAQQVAESGNAILVDSLNSNYAHLLIVDDSQWSNPPLPSSKCGNSNTGVPALTGSVGSDGTYELESYTYTGSPFYGGKANLRMRGEVRKNGQIVAAAIVLRTVDIKAKSCTNSYGEPIDSSGFPGLLGETITLGGNDVLGRMSGNVFCLGCEDESDISANNQSIISGDIFVGAVDMPAVPMPPTELSDLYNNPFSYDAKNCKGNQASNPSSCSTTDSSGNIEIIAGSTDTSKLLNGSCKVNNKITHCVVEKLLISNNELRVNTTDGPVRIYFIGTGEIFKSTGKGGITHEPSSSPSSHLGLFGNPQDPTDNTIDQEFTLRGASGANNLWAFFPDGNLGIAGGAQDDANCGELEDGSLGECTGGDIYGAVWSKSWGQTNGASSGTGVQIVVPADMGQQLFNEFGPDYSVGVRDYVALGVSKWSSFVADSAR